jgi:hypothetical protein
VAHHVFAFACAVAVFWDAEDTHTTGIAACAILTVEATTPFINARWFRNQVGSTFFAFALKNSLHSFVCYDAVHQRALVPQSGRPLLSIITCNLDVASLLTRRLLYFTPFINARWFRDQVRVIALALSI